MDFLTTVEAISVVFGLLFLLLLMRENRLCWPFGILSSALSVYLFIEAKLYAESLLYSFYVFAGAYGWWVWGRNNTVDMPVTEWSFGKKLMGFLAGLAGATMLAWFFSTKTDAEQPIADAATTSFSFLATFLEAHKVLSAWVYWMGINLVSVWLYYSRDLLIYSGLMVLYFSLSIVGWMQWRKKWRATQ